MGKGSNGMTRREFLASSTALGGLVCGVTLLQPPLDALAQSKGAENPIPPLEVTYYSDRPEMVEFWREAANDLKKLGLEVKHNPVETIQAVHKILNEHKYGSWGMIAWGASPERLEPNFYLEELLHSSRAIPRGRNYGYYKNPDYDRLVDAQKVEMNPEKRRELIWRAQEVAAKDHPVWWLMYRVDINAYNSRDWKGVVEVMGGGIGTMFNTWTPIKIQPLSSRKVAKIGTGQDIAGLNPFAVHTSPSQQVLRTIYDPFARIAPDLKVMPWAAESWKVVNDVTIDVVLRKGMKFHDGKPVTIEDAKFSIDYPKQWEIPLFRHATEVIKEVEIKGANTLRFNLVKPFAPFFAQTLTWLILLPRHIWQEIPKSVGQKNPLEWENPQCIGSGPFRLGHWRKGQEISLRANKEHFMPPPSEGVQWVIIPSTDGLLGALEMGEIDVLGHFMTPEQANALKKYPHLTVASTPSYGVYEARPDMRVKPFDDREFRRAIHHALNKQVFVNFYEGLATIGSNTPIHPQLKPWHNPNIPFVDFNIEKARKILKDAGYVWDDKGRLCFAMKG
jgi:peptide/nickel transport system substrate-binding protein